MFKHRGMRTYIDFFLDEAWLSKYHA